MFQLATSEKDNGSTGSTSNTQSQTTTTQSSSTGQESSTSALPEHQPLFGFKDSKASLPSKQKGKATGRMKKPGRTTWKKECVCLLDSQQTCKPSPKEKMELAKMGLGLCELTFNASRNADHIHCVIIDKFPVLDNIGGYTLLRLGENSRNLIEIETPEGGLSVTYLKDILNQAKLFVRPLQ